MGIDGMRQEYESYQNGRINLALIDRSPSEEEEDNNDEEIRFKNTNQGASIKPERKKHVQMPLHTSWGFRGL